MTIEVSFWRKDAKTYKQVLADEIDSGRIVEGPEKLAQRFVLHLFTRKDSIPKSSAGCEFLDRVSNSNITTENDIFAVFTSVLPTIVAAIQAEELEDDPANEKFAGVGVKELQLSAGSLKLNIVIRTSSGEKIPISIPLNFLLN